MGELLKQFDGRGGHMKKDGAVLSQEAAADGAGISERQCKTAVRVANLPAAEFDAAIEGDNPATVTALAEMGTRLLPALPACALIGHAQTHSSATSRPRTERCKACAPSGKACGITHAGSLAAIPVANKNSVRHCHLNRVDRNGCVCVLAHPPNRRRTVGQQSRTPRCKISV
jgi:hypothetical protein